MPVGSANRLQMLSMCGVDGSSKAHLSLAAFTELSDVWLLYELSVRNGIFKIIKLTLLLMYLKLITIKKFFFKV